MKNTLESFAILLVGLLSIVIVYLIVQYNMIEEESMEDISKIIQLDKKKVKKIKTADYLNSLEGYGDDVDVKVDVHKVDHTNEVAVRSEVEKDVLDEVVEDKSKSSYTENLEHYTDESDKKPLEPATPKKVEEEKQTAQPSSGEPEKIPEEVSDEIGEAIDAVLDDL